MPIVHHTIPTFTGSEVVAGVALDFKNGGAVVDELNPAATAVITAVKGWTITGDVAAPESRQARKLADTADIHAADDGPLVEAEPDIYDDVPIEEEA